MFTNRWGFFVIITLAVAAVAVFVQQRNLAARLHGELIRRRAEATELTQLKAEAQRLTAAQVSREELERLRVERKAVSALRAEIDAMKRRSEAVVPPSAIPGNRGVDEKAAAVSLKESPFPVSASQWRNRGAATPEAAFETALWAAAGGDLDALTGLMVFDGEARAKAEAIFAKLPAGLQQELVSPQRLVALLMAKDVPLGSAKIWAQYGDAADTKMVAQVIDTWEKSKQLRLSLRTEGENWRFIVPPSAVEKYAAQLQAPVAP